MKIKDFFPQDMNIVSPDQLLTDIQSFTEQPIRMNQKNIQEFEINDQSIKDNELLNTSQSQLKKKPNQKGLKKLIRTLKVKNIVKKFVEKLKLNNINSSPIIFEPYQTQQKQSFANMKGFELPDVYEKILQVFIAFYIIVCLFIDSTATIFPQILDYPVIKFGQLTALIVFLIQFFSSCTVVKMVKGKKVDKIKQIFSDYLSDKFLIDFAYLIVLITGFFCNVDKLRLVILLKLPECFERIQRLENIYVNTFYKQQYWGLAKVFLLNFAFSHFLSILLISMAGIQPTHNWMTKLEIQHQVWYQQYIWGFYWGTTIMLTVGFGDISPANYEEAMCLVLIQTFSCLTLAYNINCVGNLISNIKSQDIEKNKNIKTFKILSSRNNISQDLQIKISNYIEQSTKIKKKFNPEDELKFMSGLPTELKADFLKESNKKIFQKLVFLKDLTEKTLLTFAEVIHMKICHPKQVIKKRGQLSGLMILKQGKIAFCTKIINSEFNNITIDQIKLQQGQNPFLLSLNFISLDHSNYEIRSEEYSILYYLSLQETLQTLRTGQLDYEHFCFLRDRSRDFTNDYEIFRCQYCSNCHTKFDCPKLHFIPLKKHVIDKHLHNVKISKNQRQTDFLRKKQQFKPFIIIYKNRTLHKTYSNNLNEKQNEVKSLELQDFQKNVKTIARKAGIIMNQINEVNINLIKFIEMNKGKDITKMKSTMMGVEYQGFMDQLKDEISQIMANKNEVWLLELDQIKNYKFYFTQFNANKLAYLHKKSSALLKMDVL